MHEPNKGGPAADKPQVGRPTVRPNWVMLALMILLVATAVAWWQPLHPQPSKAARSWIEWFIYPIERNAGLRLPSAPAFFNSVSLAANGQDGWIVGHGGTILVTHDGGKVWEAQKSGTAYELNSVQFLPDAKRGWAVGTSGTLLTTTDGGNNWSSKKIDPKAKLEEIHVNRDGRRAWIVGNHGKVFRSTNGGEDWDSQTINDGSGLSSVFFDKDGERGWIAGVDAIYSTKDSGVTWSKKTTGSALWLNSIWFLDDEQQGWAVGDLGRIMKTNDGGEHWSEQDSGTSKSLRQVRASGDGKRVLASGATGTLLVLDHDAPQWRNIKTGTSAEYIGVSLSSVEKTAIVVGSGGTILLSQDSGQTWSEQTGTSRRLLRSVEVQNAGRSIWAVSSMGLILTSRDEGQNWKVVQPRQANELFGLSVLPNDRQAWAAGDNGLILVTSDGGTTWRQQSSGVTEALYDIQFHKDGKFGVAAGRDGVIVTTLDGGKHWTRVENNERNYALRKVFLADDGKNGWVVGDTGGVFFTRDQGQTWSNTPNLGSSDFNDIQFLDDVLQGWLIGEEGVILFTMDGGTEWKPQGSRTGASLNKISMQPDGRQGLVVGGAGTILYTDDGGNNWNLGNSKVGSTILDLSMDTKGLTGWAVGYPPALLSTTDGGKNWNIHDWPQRYERYPAPWYGLALALGLYALWVAFRPELIAPQSGAEAMGATDAPTDDFARDRLQFGSLARGISRFLRNTHTEPPLTVAISGDWGTGKSSLMSLVCADLRLYGYRPVWFNAWHHQNEEQLLASLLCAIRDSGLPKIWSLDGWVFRLRLLGIRIRKHYLVVLVVLFSLSALGAYLLLIDAKKLTPILETLSDILGIINGTHNPLSAAGIAGLTGILLTIATLLTALVQALKSFGVDPAVLLSAASGSFRMRDASAQTSFRSKFSTQFGEVTEALPYRMVIVIDDLDRCRPETVLTVMEAVNFLVSSGRCFIIFGMATHRVQAALALTFEKIAEELVELDVQLSDNASDEEKAKAKRKRRNAYARDYLEKLVNLEITVPQRSDLPPHWLLEDEDQNVALHARSTTRKALSPLWLGISFIIAGVLAGKYWQLHEDQSRPTVLSAIGPVVAAPSPRTPNTVTVPVITVSELSSPRYLPAVQKGDDRQISLVTLFLVLLVCLAVGTSIVLYRLRTSMRHVTDSTTFLEALRVWLPVVQRHRNTPRAIKRFGNRIRYLAMLQQEERLDRSLFHELRALRKRLMRISEQSRQASKDPCAKAVAEHQLVALGALYDTYGAMWRDHLLADRSQDSQGEDAAVHEAIDLYVTSTGATWPPAEDELEAFERTLKGVRLSGDAGL